MKMYIQGFYNVGTGLMDVGLAGCLNILDGSDPMYSPNPADVDDVTISAMDAVTFLPIESKVGRLKTNGSITVSFSGPATAGTSYFLKLTHRNLVETWSKNPVLFTSITSYDFTTASTQAYDDGFNYPMKEVAPGLWACFNGDIDQLGDVNSLDMTAVENDSNIGAFGYNLTDINGDGGSDVKTLPVVVLNVAPTATLSNADDVTEGTVGVAYSVNCSDWRSRC